MRTSISGAAWRSSYSTNPTRSAAPATRHANVRRSVQPQTADCWRPSTRRPMPAETSSAPVVDRDGTALLRRARLQRERDRDQRDRDVDPEDRAPRPLGQVAAEERADGGQRAGDAEEDGHRASALLARERGDDDGERGGEEDRAERALGDAEDDHPRLAERPGGCSAAERRAHREARDADGEHAPMTEHVGELAAEREAGGEREQVAVDDPLRAGGGDREIASRGRGWRARRWSGR